MTKYRLTKIILETFLEESGINDRIDLGDEKARILGEITRTRFAGWDRVAQADKFHISLSTLDKYIAEIKELYDETQKNSLILPIRHDNSKEEEILDNTKNIEEL